MLPTSLYVWTDIVSGKLFPSTVKMVIANEKKDKGVRYFVQIFDTDINIRFKNQS